jgi:uncharacterized protein YbaR (Trm112 family)
MSEQDYDKAEQRKGTWLKCTALRQAEGEADKQTNRNGNQAKCHMRLFPLTTKACLLRHPCTSIANGSLELRRGSSAATRARALPGVTACSSAIRQWPPAPDVLSRAGISDAVHSPTDRDDEEHFASTRTMIDARLRVLLTAALQRTYPVVASVPLMLEYESVLTRSEHFTVARISMADAEVLLNAIALVAEPIRILCLWRPMLPDPGDDLVLEPAVKWTCRRRGHVQSWRLCAGVGPLRIRSRAAGRRCTTARESLMKKSNFCVEASTGRDHRN